MIAPGRQEQEGMTISSPTTLSGRGMHSGAPAQIILRPARHPAGIFFRIRGSNTRIPALISRLTCSERTVRLADGGSEVSGVEHIMAACYGLGICCLEIELSTNEIPGLDGSAQPFVQAMDSAVLVPCGGEVPALNGVSVLIEHSSGKRIALEATSEAVLEVCYSVDFEAFGGTSESVSLRIDEGVFRREIAPARTFVISGHDLRALPGLDGPLLWTSTPPSSRRFPDEFVRHKVLDLIGDLALLGRPLTGKVSVNLGGHSLHLGLATAIGQVVECH